MPIIGNNVHGELPGLVHYPGPRQEVNLRKVKTDVISKGDVLFPDLTANPPVYKVCGTSGAEQGPYAVAIKDAANGDDTVHAVVSGAIVTVTTSGEIAPGGVVKPSTDVAGQVEAWEAPDGAVVSDAVPSLAEFNLKVGQYLKQANSVPQGDGVNFVPTAQDGDVIQIVVF